MKKENNETLEQYLNRRNAEYDKALEEKQNKKKKKKSKRKGLILAVWLFVVAGVTALTGSLVHLLKNRNDLNNKQKDIIETVIDDDMSLADLGFEEEKTDENVNNVIYGNTTGNVDKDKVVEKDGTIWKDQDAADKSNQVGKTTIDDKNGTLIVKPNGTVTEKDKNYEVKDETGKVTQSGSNDSGIPEGYVWDAELNKYVPKAEAGLYTYADANYYNEEGTIIIKKGDKVLKTTLENIKKICTTTKPVTSGKDTTNNNTTNNKPSTENTTNNNTSNNKPSTENNNTTNENEVTQEEGKVNQNGTYTIYGTTYMDKATFQAFILDDNATENFGLYNGVIYPKSVINEMSAQKTK